MRYKIKGVDGEIDAIQVDTDLLAGKTPLPEWMQGKAQSRDFDGVSAKIEILAHGSYWIVNVGDWFIGWRPGVGVMSPRLFKEHYEAIE